MHMEKVSIVYYTDERLDLEDVTRGKRDLYRGWGTLYQLPIDLQSLGVST